jgi:hypothetical protein
MRILCVVLVWGAGLPAFPQAIPQSGDWPAYGRDPGVAASPRCHLVRGSASAKSESPDGQALAFLSDREESQQIWLLTAHPPVQLQLSRSVLRPDTALLLG